MRPSIFPHTREEVFGCVAVEDRGGDPGDSLPARVPRSTAALRPQSRVRTSARSVEPAPTCPCSRPCCLISSSAELGYHSAHRQPPPIAGWKTPSNVTSRRRPRRFVPSARLPGRSHDRNRLQVGRKAPIPSNEGTTQSCPLPTGPCVTAMPITSSDKPITDSGASRSPWRSEVHSGAGGSGFGVEV